MKKKSLVEGLSLLSVLALSLAVVSCCTKNDSADKEYSGMSETSFVEYTAEIINPERGFYSPFFVDASSPKTIGESTLAAVRVGKRSLVLLEFGLGKYIESDIEDSFLTVIQSNFDAVRKTGLKAIVRFAYKWDNGESDRPWDATLEWSLRHIAQLKPLLQKNGDVILCLQAGFVGAWGEWYYTDNFGMNPSSDADYEPRRQLLNAELDAMPSNRQVQVRTPAFKQRIFHFALADTLTASSAFQNTPKARVGGHNDCFVASSSDYGTFNGSADRAYWNAETRYTIMGGETCAVSAFCECENTMKDMELQHWTYLNKAYNASVLGKWNTGGCMDEIVNRLGFRLVLEKLWVDKAPKAGDKMRVAIHLRNDGFASIINPRGLELIFVSADGKKTVVPLTEDDPRYWFAGTRNIVDVTVDTPPESGEYTLYLNLPDPEKSLHDNPCYSIRLANKNVWEEASGYNKLVNVVLL